MLPSWLPGLESACDPKADSWPACEDNLFNHFLTDFVSNPIYIGSLPVKVHKDPQTNGRHRSFWHLISEGLGEEALRSIRAERCERIRWPREIIKNIASNEVLKWRKLHDGRIRTILAVGDYEYVVVLEREQEAITLITAYDVDKRKRRKQFKRDHAEYLAGKGAIKPP